MFVLMQLCEFFRQNLWLLRQTLIEFKLGETKKNESIENNVLPNLQ